jgi:large subunit ribosomal protein L4
MPRKMRRGALRSALSALAAGDQIVVVDKLELDAPKTSVMAGVLYNLVGDSSALVLMAERNDAVENSVRNLANAVTLRASYLNVRDLLKYDRLVIPQAALEVIQIILGQEAKN